MGIQADPVTVYDALYGIGILSNTCLVRHEQAAVHMADGYARAQVKLAW